MEGKNSRLEIRPKSVNLALTPTPLLSYFPFVMIWDAFLVSALSRELDHRLGGTRLRGHIFRWDERELVLFFRSVTLRWHLHPARGWLTLEEAQELPEEARPLSAQVKRVLSFADERILEIHLQRSRGRVRHYRLVLELMTNQWNALLLEGSQGTVRHLLWTRDLEDRTLVVGREYRPPPPSGRLGIDAPLTPEDWEGILGGLTGSEARRALLEKVAFTSPINVSLFLGEGLKGPDPGTGRLGRQALLEVLREGKAQSPCVLEIGSDKQPYPIVIESFESEYFPDLLSAIQAASQGESAEEDTISTTEEHRLEQALRQARGRVKGIRRELEEAADPEEIRTMANLLLARLAEVPRGADSVVLQGFEGERVEVPLDPALAPQENAEAFYREAGRRERALDRLPHLLQQAEGELASLEDLQKRMAAGTATVEEVRAQLPQGATRKKKPGQQQEERLPYHSFLSSGGLEIRVGRGSRENDELTFRYSRPDDVWLHARESAGAHVILRWDREENPPRKDLTEAAILAALNSGARGSGTVPVDWTRRKYVRKPRKAPPGTVLPGEVQTVFVEPDPELPRRLKARRPDPS